jgi:uncharacterized protein
MIPRLLTDRINWALEHFPAVGLVGARQVGKTTLAQMVAESFPRESVYLDLERAADYSLLSEPEQYLSMHADQLVIIDEIQTHPELFPELRGLIDRDRRTGRFLLLGSSSPALKRQSGESLAGRISYHELTGLLSDELDYGVESRNMLWLRGGFPDSCLAVNDEVSIAWREGFIQTYLQRDLSMMGYDVRTPAITMRRFWRMLAHCHGQFANMRQFASNLDLSWQTIRKYADMLEETFMIRQLPPFFANLKKRLVKTPRIYLRDSGVLHRLLDIGSMDALMSHPVLGASWEGFCIEQILARAPSGWMASFYRTQAGAEIDLILEPQAFQPPIAVEFKYSLAPKLTKGFWSAHSDLKPRASFVVYPGQESYPIANGVQAIPLTEINRLWTNA